MIVADADKVLKALADGSRTQLLDGEFTPKYWEHDNVSDQKPGSTWEPRRSDRSGQVDLVGTVVESSPPLRLVVTWAYPADAASREKQTRVTFEVEPVDDMPCLTHVLASNPG
jgi:uncharacterized protein YndB with AHSA1/START domain